MCVEECDLSIIWSHSKSEKNCEAIWKYLQTLALLGTTIRSKNTNLEDFFDQFENDMYNVDANIQDQMLNLVNKLLQENDDVKVEEVDLETEETQAKSEESSESIPSMDSQYQEMFQNTKIGNLAKRNCGRYRHVFI